MKKMYEPPVAEKLAFNYRDQVVASSTGNETPTPTQCNLEYVESWWPESLGGPCNVLEYND